MDQNADPVTVTVWWTPDCGYLHVETDPVHGIGPRCPDGIPPEQEPEPGKSGAS